jgi:hypothetical protein
MSYRITIAKVEPVKTVTGKAWTVISESDGHKEYGYTPGIEQETQNVQEIFSLNLKTLDLGKVIAAIKAINKKT